MIVADASAVAQALGHADHRGANARVALSADPDWLVPEHWVVEVVSALRGLHLGGSISEPVASFALHTLRAATFQTVPTLDLLDAIWAMRANVSAYDAAYLAIAALHDLPLLTADQRLAQAAIGHCRVELV